MIYISLPSINFTKEHTIGLYLFYREHKEWFDRDLKLSSLHGAFPFSFWNGDLNSNINNDIALHFNLNQIQSSLAISARLNCANINLVPTDFKDRRLTDLLQVFYNGSSWIEVSNLEFAQYIKSQWPNYRLVFSSNAHYINAFTPEILNLITEQNLFELIELPPELAQNKDFLAQLKQRNLYEVPILKTICDKSGICKASEQEAQYSFSRESCHKYCSKCTGYKNIQDFYSLTELRQIYGPLGITHFKLPSLYLSNDAWHKFVLFFIKYFIKEDYQGQALNLLLTNGANIWTK